MSPGRIKTLRKALDLTQQEFADLIGAQRPTIARWETGTNKPTGANLKALRELAENAKRKEKKKALKGERTREQLPPRPDFITPKHESLQQGRIKKTLPVPLEPKVYLPSTSHPDYLKKENSYIVDHTITDREVEKLQDRNAASTARKIMVSHWLEWVLQGWQEIPGEGSYSEQAAKHVIGALKEYGLDALRLPAEKEKAIRDKTKRRIESRIKTMKEFGFDEGLFSVSELERFVEDNDVRSMRNRPLEAMDQLGAAICDAIRYWQDQADKGSPEAKRRASKHLREVARAALMPDMRGRRKGRLTATHLQVKSHYYKELFRIYHIQKALQSTPETRSEKVRSAGERFEMPVELIREFWGLDQRDRLLRGSGAFTYKDMARELTARHFGIKHQTILNILAS